MSLINKFLENTNNFILIILYLIIFTQRVPKVRWLEKYLEE